jgi:hypothetical protein
MKQLSLDYAIHNAKFPDGTKNTDPVLNEAQQNAILSIIGKGCRQPTKERLARRLALPLSLWERFGIYSRLIIEEAGAYYICGQSWNDEMRTLRECILK